MLGETNTEIEAMNSAKNAMRTLIVGYMCLSVTAIAGCSGQPASTPSDSIKTRCLNGVSYYLFKEDAGYSGYGYMAPKYKSDGTIHMCNNAD